MDEDPAKTIRALSEEFPKHVIQMKPGSQRKPATPYVSHGSVTKRLNEVCPGWSTRLIEMHSYLNANGALVCAGVTLEMTVPGAGSHVEFGVANQPRSFGDDAKNAMSDALKRCAMRFGVALDLWESADEHDEDAEQTGSAGNGVAHKFDSGSGNDRHQQPQRPTPAPPAASNPHPLLAEIRDVTRTMQDRERALTDYYMGAHTIAELNTRQEAVKGCGLGSRAVAETYNFHAKRIERAAPVPHPGVNG